MEENKPKWKKIVIEDMTIVEKVWCINAAIDKTTGKLKDSAVHLMYLGSAGKMVNYLTGYAVPVTHWKPLDKPKHPLINKTN